MNKRFKFPDELKRNDPGPGTEEGTEEGTGEGSATEETAAE